MREQICFAIERIKSGSTQSPICLIPSLKSPANLNPSGKDPNRLNSGSENRRRSLKCIAPCMPRLPSLRRIVRAGFLGSNFTALKPWPVMWVSEVPTRILFQNLKDRYFPQPRKEPPAAPEAWSSRRAIPLLGWEPFGRQGGRKSTKVFPDSDENHALPRLGHAEVHGVHQPGRALVA